MWDTRRAPTVDVEILRLDHRSCFTLKQVRECAHSRWQVLRAYGNDWQLGRTKETNRQGASSDDPADIHSRSVQAIPTYQEMPRTSGHRKSLGGQKPHFL